MSVPPDPAIQLYETLGPYLAGAAAALLLLAVVVAVGIWISLARASKALVKQAETQRYQVEVIKWLGTLLRESGAGLPPGDPPMDAAVTKVSTSTRSVISASAPSLSLSRQGTR
ncbi:MAG: hypothetical protein KC503_42710 [Myxococcales bacterium]|nr:hypothetical protein [Myxococcales bacterium]